MVTSVSAEHNWDHAEPVKLYALPPDTTFFEGFDRFAAERIPDGARVLDIGPGKGWPYTRLLAKARLTGVDPDPMMHENHYLQERHHCKVQEMPPAHFDAAVASFVLEHVEDVPAFLAGVRRRADRFIFSTPNLHHYFGSVSQALQHLGLQEVALRLLGRDSSYHRPTYYRMNTPDAVNTAGQAAGFRLIEIAMFDNPDHLGWYFPRALQWVPRAYSRQAYRRGWTKQMATMFVAMS